VLGLVGVVLLALVSGLEGLQRRTGAFSTYICSKLVLVFLTLASLSHSPFYLKPAPPIISFLHRMNFFVQPPSHHRQSYINISAWRCCVKSIEVYKGKACCSCWRINLHCALFGETLRGQSHEGSYDRGKINGTPEQSSSGGNETDDTHNRFLPFFVPFMGCCQSLCVNHEATLSEITRTCARKAAEYLLKFGKIAYLGFLELSFRINN